MNEKWWVIGAACIAASTASAQGQLNTGNEFLQAVERMDSASRDGRGSHTLEFGNSMAVLHLVRGIRETNGIINLMNESTGTQNTNVACIPPSATVGQLVRVIRSELEKTPAVLHAPFTMLAQGVLVRIYPCK